MYLHQKHICKCICIYCISAAPSLYRVSNWKWYFEFLAATASNTNTSTGTGHGHKHKYEIQIQILAIRWDQNQIVALPLLALLASVSVPASGAAAANQFGQYSFGVRRSGNKLLEQLNPTVVPGQGRRGNRIHMPALCRINHKRIKMILKR